MSEPNLYKRVLIVFNPVAGIGNSTLITRRLIALCDKAGIEHKLYVTKQDEDLSTNVRQFLSDGIDLVLVCGGDGTISSVASSLVSTGIPLAIIPIGTGNALAKELGIPRTVEAAFRLINHQHSIKRLDAMKINNAHYVLNVGVGLSSIIIKNTERQEKKRYGIFAYIWKGVIAFAGLQPHRFTLVVDGKRFDQNASEIFIAGGGIIGVQIPQLSQEIVVRPDDGILDIFVIKAKTIRDYFALGFNILLGKPRKAPHLLYFQAKNQISVFSNRKLPVESDGEFIGYTPLTVNMVPAALDVVVPNQKTGVISRWKDFVKLIDISNKIVD
jgi:diacylglycerol kinase (ATP)